MRLSSPTTCRGVTLIELAVAVAVMGILAAVAYPNYTAYVKRSRRADAMALLTSVVQAQERYRANKTAYAAELTDLNLSAQSITRYYTVEIAGVGAMPSLTSGYLATASVVSGGPQARDADCATLAIKLEGARLRYLATNSAGADTRATCWGR